MTEEGGRGRRKRKEIKAGVGVEVGMVRVKAGRVMMEAGEYSRCTFPCN